MSQLTRRAFLRLLAALGAALGLPASETTAAVPPLPGPLPPAKYPGTPVPMTIPTIVGSDPPWFGQGRQR